MKFRFAGWMQYLLLAATVLVVMLFFQNRAIDVEQHNRRLDLLLHLTESEGALDRLVLLTTFFRLNQYDPFVDKTQRVRQLFAEIEKTGAELKGEVGIRFRADLAEYLDAMREKLRLLEQIKSKTALVRNGLHYLPLAVKETDALSPLLNELLYCTLFPTDANLHNLHNLIDKAKPPAATTGTGLDAFNNALFHMRANLRLMGELAELRDSYTAVPSRERFNSLQHAYAGAYAHLTQRSELYSLLLLALTVALFTGLGLALRKNARSRAAAEHSWEQLHDAVESLSEAFALFSSEGRMVLCNKRYLEFYPWLSELLQGDATLDEIFRQNTLFARLRLTGYEGSKLPVYFPELAKGGTQTYLEQYEDNRWYLASDTRTSSGEIACVRFDISQGKKTEQELRKLYRAVEQSPASVVITDTQGRIEYVNPKFEETTGYAAEEVLGQNPRLLKSGDKSEKEYQELWSTITSGKVWRGQFHNRRKDGTIYWESASISPVRDYDGVITHFIAVKEDITAQKRAEDQLRLNATVFDTTTEGIMVTDADNRIKSVNPSFTRITGYLAEEVIGRSPRMLSSGRQDTQFYEELWRQLYKRGYWSGEIWNRRKDGAVYPEWLSLALILDEKGNVTEHVGVFSDITQRKADEEQIRYQANYDALTGLPNRSLLEDRLDRAVAGARRERSKLALLFVDLDHFKTVNDTLGHVVGDELLQQATGRMRVCLREADTLARFGGDEFVILLDDVRQAEDAAEVAKKIIDAMSKPFVLGGRELFVGASIGISLYPEDTQETAVLLRNADMAMYRAKETGRNRYQFFTFAMNEQVYQRMEMERNLRTAVDRDELFLCYQPIVDLQNERVVSVEALLRWRHPDEGVIDPDRFISLAEETGVIAGIGLWVLRQACAQAAGWRRQGIELAISVNVSPRQLTAGLRVDQIKEILAETGLPAAALKLEITESLMLQADTTLDWVDDLRELGVGLSLDDFGTGYSSLSYLKRFQMDILKIDRSFVSGLSRHQGDNSLVQTIMAMAASLGLEVIAEGVETQEQLGVLRQLGCRYIQGFLFSEPVVQESLLERVGAIQADFHRGFLSSDSG
ncbi:MAG: diguanylate cyclase [Gammaproteobacteria bacterium RIFOXYA12_FULL_61_12]|nr:MAG: diguanylate cyclase [Gammaproteobacteria bacterium RIFOXYD12_FULL_61_37]OGT94104.1 MAG: diguanylate cyclase [Gammaproteobacteria bacterium RIFOXYA12_FULL_61_12]